MLVNKKTRIIRLKIWLCSVLEYGFLLMIYYITFEEVNLHYWHGKCLIISTDLLNLFKNPVVVQNLSIHWRVSLVFLELMMVLEESDAWFPSGR